MPGISLNLDAEVIVKLQNLYKDEKYNSVSDAANSLLKKSLKNKK